LTKTPAASSASSAFSACSLARRVAHACRRGRVWH
jgi:hypothetical protein